MRKLNIAIACDPITHLTAGSVVSTLRFAERLKSRGHHVIFLAAKDKDRNLVGERDGITIYRFSSMSLPLSKGQYILALPVAKRLRRIMRKERIDIVHVIDPTPLSIAAVRAARTMGIPTVAHSHTQPENLCFQLPRIAQRRALKNFIYRYMVWIYKQVDIVICPSKFAERMLRRYDKNLDIRVVSNGVDLARFKKIPHRQYIANYRLSAKHKRILYVGRLHKEKSVHTIIEAMPLILRQFKNVHLDIVGAGHLRPELEVLAKVLGVSPHVTFLGKLPEKDLLMAYNACDMFVLPSIAELEGMVVLEAMACGKPIIISDSRLSASSDFVNGNGYIFRLQDPVDLAAKALLLLRNPAKRRSMGAASAAMVKNFDIERSVSTLESIYASLLR